MSTVVLFLLLGTTLPAFAQKAEEEKGGGKTPQAQQHAQKAQPKERAEKVQPQQAKQSGRQQGQTVASTRGGGHYGRIPDTDYQAHFGHS